MSRRAPSGEATQMGWVYTLHFLPAYGKGRQQAKHYTGFTTNPATRIAAHRRGGSDTARLLQVQKKAGGTFLIAAIEPGTRDREAQLKERGAVRRCPVCKAERAGLPLPPDVPIPDGPPAAPPSDLGFPAVNPLASRKPLTSPRARRGSAAAARQRTAAQP